MFANQKVHKVFEDQIDTENRGTLLNRIKEIRLEKLQEQQILELVEQIVCIERIQDEQNDDNKKLSISLDKISIQNNELLQQNNQLTQDNSNLKETLSNQKLRTFKGKQKLEYQICSNNKIYAEYFSKMKFIDQNLILNNRKKRKSKFLQMQSKITFSLNKKNKNRNSNNKDVFIFTLEGKIKQFENLIENKEQEKIIIKKNLTKNLEYTINGKDRQISSLFSETKQFRLFENKEIMKFCKT
ncbi:unnamed protein product [Paramecium sonneborni]|uniref:Uncharacterized protein n=1 Tax=Paramecium sonneborni TaxID=65129 RepID=A0A8S1RLJ4_9CILI|nr:unnamed protein product [Paramecium sonneborni]